MSLICKRYNINPKIFVKMVRDGVISTDVVTQFEFAETCRQLLTTGKNKTEAVNETARYFQTSPRTIYRALSRFND